MSTTKIGPINAPTSIRNRTVYQSSFLGASKEGDRNPTSLEHRSKRWYSSGASSENTMKNRDLHVQLSSSL